MWSRIRLISVAGVLSVAAVAGAVTLAQAQPSGSQTAPATATATPVQPSGGRGGMSAGRMDEYLNRLAGNLGVTPDRLRDALRQTAIQEVDAAVARGDIPADRAQEIKERIQNRQVPPLGPEGPRARGRGHHRPSDVIHDMKAVATFLGIDGGQLREELRGKSLAQVAQAHGKTREQLIQFLTERANARLEQAVRSGRITPQMADRLRQNQQEMIERMVDRVHPVDGPIKPGRAR